MAKTSVYAALERAGSHILRSTGPDPFASQAEVQDTLADFEGTERDLVDELARDIRTHASRGRISASAIATNLARIRTDVVDAYDLNQNGLSESEEANMPILGQLAVQLARELEVERGSVFQIHGSVAINGRQPVLNDAFQELTNTLSVSSHDATRVSFSRATRFDDSTLEAIHGEIHPGEPLAAPYKRVSIDRLATWLDQNLPGVSPLQSSQKHVYQRALTTTSNRRDKLYALVRTLTAEANPQNLTVFLSPGTTTGGPSDILFFFPHAGTAFGLRLVTSP